MCEISVYHVFVFVRVDHRANLSESRICIPYYFLLVDAANGIFPLEIIRTIFYEGPWH
jgi:hypothetical protein